jgi:hypothetical protein
LHLGDELARHEREELHDTAAANNEKHNMITNEKAAEVMIGRRHPKEEDILGYALLKCKCLNSLF